MVFTYAYLMGYKMKRRSVRYIYLLLLGSVFCRAGSSAIIINNSIPKAGSYLLVNVICQLTSRKGARHLEAMRPMNKVLLSIPNREYIEINHIIYSKDTAKAFRQAGCKVLFIYRDPRAQVLSYADWVYKHPNSYRWMNGIAHDEVITSLISDGRVYRGLSSYPWKHIHNVNEFYHAFMPWLNEDFVCSVRFEDLVGAKGGGSDDAQLQALKTIASYLDCDVSEQELVAISQKLFGNAGTFCHGQIDRWRQVFTSAQIALFKEVAGQLLIDLGYEQDLEW